MSPVPLKKKPNHAWCVVKSEVEVDMNMDLLLLSHITMEKKIINSLGKSAKSFSNIWRLCSSGIRIKISRNKTSGMSKCNHEVE
jgi:hypothetical protein